MCEIWPYTRDTSRSAEGMRAIWQRTPWGSNTQLDGVLMVDPVFLQELTKISGNVTIPDGTVLTGDNTAEFLLNKVYVDYPVSMQDALFAQVAEQAVGSMFSNIDLAKLTKVAQLMGSMAEGRHFSMYAFDETAEKTISDAGFTAQTPSSEEHPQVGVYVTEQNPSKMGWYIHRTSRIQLVSATAGFGSACFDCSLAISSSHTSLGVLYPRSFMGVSLISPTIASSSSCVRSSKLVPLGR